MTDTAAPRRRYDSTLRRQRAAETTDRIVAAAFELLRRSSIRDWRAVTIRAVAEQAGVNERTVYRHFPNERALRDAVMQRFQAKAGIDLDHVTLGDVADLAARTIGIVAAHPSPPRPPMDPTLGDTDRRRRDALLRAVDTEAADWPEPDRKVAAAVLDVLWSVGAYERLAVDWGLGRDEAVRAVRWAIGLVEAAVRKGEPPPT